jgi:hypothetical protein
MQAVAHYHSQTPAHAEPYRARVAAAWLAERESPLPSAAALPALASTPALASAPARGVAGGGAMLDNGAARITPLMNASGSGRGLEAYRAMPIPLAGRGLPAPRTRS